MNIKIKAGVESVQLKQGKRGLRARIILEGPASDDILDVARLKEEQPVVFLALMDELPGFDLGGAMAEDGYDDEPSVDVEGEEEVYSAPAALIAGQDFGEEADDAQAKPAGEPVQAGLEEPAEAAQEAVDEDEEGEGWEPAEDGQPSRPISDQYPQGDVVLFCPECGADDLAGPDGEGNHSCPECGFVGEAVA